MASYNFSVTVAYFEICSSINEILFCDEYQCMAEYQEILFPECGKFPWKIAVFFDAKWGFEIFEVVTRKYIFCNL